MAAEPAVDGDAHFRDFQRHSLVRAATHFRHQVTAPPLFGWRLRTASAPVLGPDGPRWLRVVSEQPVYAHGCGWTGTEDANTVTGVPKPVVLDSVEGTNTTGAVNAPTS